MPDDDLLRGASVLAPVVARPAAEGADVLPAGPDDELPVTTDGVGQVSAPLPGILPLQQPVWRLPPDRDGDPARPRVLAKVTRTW